MGHCMYQMSTSGKMGSLLRPPVFFGYSPVILCTLLQAAPSAMVGTLVIKAEEDENTGFHSDHGCFHVAYRALGSIPWSRVRGALRHQR